MTAPNSYSFSNRDGSFLNENGGANVPYIVVPLTGTTVALPAGTLVALINPAGTLAALTIKLPSNPQSNDSIQIGYTKALTSLTVQDAAGSAITGSGTAATANTSAEYRYLAGAWQRWR